MSEEELARIAELSMQEADKKSCPCVIALVEPTGEARKGAALTNITDVKMLPALLMPLIIKVTKGDIKEARQVVKDIKNNLQLWVK